MKKKGILLLGSLTLMVVAMVFIAVTLVSRANVTPETSDAATLKKKDVSISSLSSSSKPTSTRRYSYMPMEVGNYLNTYPEGVNTNGYVVGNTVSPNRVPFTVIWNPKGKPIDLPGLNWSFFEHTGINDSNTIIAVDTNRYLNKVTAIKYSVSGGQVELKQLLGNKDPKPIMKPIMKTSQNRFFTEEPQVYSQDSRPRYINNDGDVVGISNNKAVLWINNVSEPVDLSTTLRIKEQSLITEANYISDRKDGVVKILGTTFEDNNSFWAKYKMFVMEYSIKEKKIISNKVQDNINGEKFLLVEPKRILSDGSIVANYVPVSEKGGFRWDGYIFSNTNFTENIKLRDILSKYGISSSTYWIVDINDTTILGYYGLDDYWGNIKYFLVNYRTNTVEYFDDLVASGAFVGYELKDYKSIQPLFINSNGDIVIEVDEHLPSGLLRYPARLSLISE